MKKKIICLLLALCMLLALLPAVVFAADANFQVTTAAGAVTSYDSFSAALTAAQENNGSTLKCFADVNDLDIEINKGNFTIDANGKTFSSTISIGSEATVTIDGNGIFNKIASQSIIYVNGTLNIKSGTFYQTYSDGQVVGLVEAGHGGTINIFGGDFNQVRATVNGIITGGSFRLMSVAGGVQLSGGKYKQLKVNMGNTNGVSVYLADGYGIKYKGSWADASATSIGSQSDDDYYVEVVATPFQVTTAAGAVTGYDSFSAALTAAQDNSGSTLKCFADVNNGNITITKGNFTIDANGKKFTSNIQVNSGAEVTIDGNGTFEPDSHSLSIFSVFGILNIKSGNFYYRYLDGTCGGAISVKNGTLNISGGDFDQVDAIGNGTISGGTFQSMYVAANTKLRGGKYKLLEVDLEANNLDAYLADGYGIKYKGGWADASVTTIGSTEDSDYYVEIVEIPFQVTTADGVVTSYDSFSAALAAAQENNGSTLKCFADVNDTDIPINKGNFTIDANGKTFTSTIKVNSGATVTIDGNGTFNRIAGRLFISASGGILNIKSGSFGWNKLSSGTPVAGRIQSTDGGTLNISGGTFYDVEALNQGRITGGTFRRLRVDGAVTVSGGKYKQIMSYRGDALQTYLTDGYGIQYLGSWKDASGNSFGSTDDTDYYVEVAESPIQDFDLQLTETEDGNLTVEVQNLAFSSEKYEDSQDLRYQYKVDDGSWSASTADNTYTFAPGSAGNHTVSVKATLYLDCEKSLDYYVIGYQSEDGVGTVASGVKFDGVAYTLSEDTFTRDGFVQIGWRDEQGNEYDLGETYTEDAGATMSPVWEEKITVEVPFTTTVDLGDNTEPGEKTFALELVSSKAGGDWEPNVTIEGSVTTDGAGNYSGKLKFTGLYDEIRRLLCESALVRQVNDGAENWTYDDTVYALVMMDDAALARDLVFEPNIPAFHIYIYPATEVEDGYYEFDWEGESLEEMSFKNTYTLHTHDYAQKFDDTEHWDACDCGDEQNRELHRYGEWNVTKVPTTNETGEQERVCSVCGYTQTADLEKLPAGSTGSGTNGTPKAGDSGNLALWIALLAVSMAACVGIGIHFRKKSAK